MKKSQPMSLLRIMATNRNVITLASRSPPALAYTSCMHSSHHNMHSLSKQLAEDAEAPHFKDTRTFKIKIMLGKQGAISTLFKVHTYELTCAL